MKKNRKRNRKFKNEELERERLRAEIQQEINSHKITFTPEVYKKSPEEREALKKMKSSYKLKVEDEENV